MEGGFSTHALCRTETLSSLACVGEEFDGTYPWHRTRDPFLLLLAERFLRQTTRVVAARVYQRLAADFPTAPKMAGADGESVVALAAEAGLFSRAAHFPSWLRRFSGLAVCQPHDPHS